MAVNLFVPTEQSVLGESTVLTVASTASTTVLTVTNIAQFLSTDFLVLGALGNELSEVVTASATTGSTGFTVSTTKFAHPVSTPVSQLRYDKVRLYGSTASDGTYSIISTSSIGVDKPLGTFISYTGSSNTYFKTTYYNTTTSVEYPPVADAPIIDGSEKTWYSTLSSFKQYAGITGSSQDGQILALLPIYTDLINTYCLGDPAATFFLSTYTDTVSPGNTMTDMGSGLRPSDILVMPNGPIQSVSAISLDGTAIYPGLCSINKLEGRRIFIDTIVPGGSVTRRTPVSVTYIAGYTNIPGGIKLAMHKMLQLGTNKNIRDSVGIKEYRIADKMVKYDGGSGTSDGMSGSAFPPEVEALLRPFIRTKLYLWE